MADIVNKYKSLSVKISHQFIVSNWMNMVRLNYVKLCRELVLNSLCCHKK